MALRLKLFLAILFLWLAIPIYSFSSDQHSAVLPLTFEPNRGQLDPQALFLARANDGFIVITQDGVVLNSPASGPQHHVRIRLRGQEGLAPAGESPTGGFANYYRSQERSQWFTHIPLYAQVRYPSIARGVDVLLHSREGQLEYDFKLLPGASTQKIRFSLEGADKVRLAADGNLEVISGSSNWRLLRPTAYQIASASRHTIPVKYKILGDGSIGFKLGAYDHSLPLTIDPVVQYSAIIGVNNDITVSGISVDAAGDLFITGSTFATNYPVVNGQQHSATGSQQVYITKLNPAGDTILYSTYMPASGFSTASSLALDSSGDAYVIGIAGGSDFPLTSTNLGTCSPQLCNAGFVAKFAPDGTLAYATLLSSGQTLPKSIAVDGAGSAYVSGLTDSSLQAVNAFESTPVGSGFFAKLNPTGTDFIFASYFGDPLQPGSGLNITGIALDGSGNIFLAGQGTNPAILNPWQVGGALFIAKFAPDGQTLLFSSGFGGSSGSITGIAVGADGTLFLAGRASSDFPFSLNAPSHIVQDNGNAMFAAAVNPALTGFTYSNYLGDGNVDAVFLNPANNHFYVAGAAVQNLPPLANAVVSDVSTTPGFPPGFAMELDPLGAPVTVTQFGGRLTQEELTAITADASNSLYVAGRISPQNEFPQPDPVVVGPSFGGVTGGSFGSFFAKIISANAPQISLNTTPPFLILRNAGSADLHISNIALSGGLSKRWGNCANTVPAGTSCVLTVSDANGGLAIGTITITSDAHPSVQTFSINLPPGLTPGGAIGDLVLFSDTSTFYPPNIAGNPTPPRDFVVSNAGTANATITGIFANGGVSETDNCPVTLPPGTSCTVQAVVDPNPVLQPSLRFTYDTGGFKDFELFVPIANRLMLLSTLSLNFNTQQIGGVAIPRVVTVTNTGSGSVTVPAPSLTGDPQFTLVGNTCTLPLPSHQSCAVAVQFNPVISGDSSATLSLAADQVQLFGQGEFNSVIRIAPLQLSFFPVIVHRTPTTTTLTLTNTSASSVGLAGFAFSLPDYSETDDCAGQIPANGSCSVQVGFSAQGVGPRDATMTMNFLGGVASQTLSLTGGVGELPMDVTPASLTFGSALISTTSPSQNVILGNGRQGTAQDYTLTVTGDFVITENTCANPMPGFFGCGDLQIAFAPKSAGPLQGTLTVSYPGITEQSVVALTGTGVSSAAVVSLPASFDLGSVPVAAGALHPVTVSNVGNADLTISNFSISGPNRNEFSIAAGQCATVPAGGNCAIQVGFNPNTPLQKQAILTITDNGLNGPHSLALTGTGVGPQIALPGPTFIGQALVSSFATNQIFVGNGGNADLLISSLTFQGPNAGDFSADIGLCSDIPAATANCSIKVTFTPTAAGTRTATMIINDNQFLSPQSLTVSGNGIGPDFQLSGAGSGSVTATVSSGQPATYNLNLASSSGFAGNVTLTCTGAPQFATCGVAPSTAKLSANGLTTIAVNVTTQQTVAALSGPQVFFAGFGVLSLVPLIPLLFSRRLRAKARSNALVVVSFLLLAGAVVATVGCGGGGGSSTPPPVIKTTPAGTYTLTITGTSGNKSHQINLTLVVQ